MANEPYHVILSDTARFAFANRAAESKDPALLAPSATRLGILPTSRDKIPCKAEGGIGKHGSFDCVVIRYANNNSLRMTSLGSGTTKSLKSRFSAGMTTYDRTTRNDNLQVTFPRQT